MPARAPRRPSRSSLACRGVDEAIADAPAVDDVPPGLRIELAPQPARVGVERARAAQRAKAPDVAQQLGLREPPRGIGGERSQEAELLVGELHRLTRNPDLAAGRIHDDL